MCKSLPNTAMACLLCVIYVRLALMGVGCSSYLSCIIIWLSPMFWGINLKPWTSVYSLFLLPSPDGVSIVCSPQIESCSIRLRVCLEALAYYWKCRWKSNHLIYSSIEKQHIQYHWRPFINSEVTTWMGNHSLVVMVWMASRRHLLGLISVG